MGSVYTHSLSTTSICVPLYIWAYASKNMCYHSRICAITREYVLSLANMCHHSTRMCLIGLSMYTQRLSTVYTQSLSKTSICVPLHIEPNTRPINVYPEPFNCVYTEPIKSWYQPLMCHNTFIRVTQSQSAVYTQSQSTTYVYTEPVNAMSLTGCCW